METEPPLSHALADMYLREHWDRIEAICKLNGLPFNATGEKIQERGIWCVYEFELQLHAIQFWDAFEGRWLRGNAFIYPKRPHDLPKLKPVKNLYGKRDPHNGWL